MAEIQRYVADIHQKHISYECIIGGQALAGSLFDRFSIDADIATVKQRKANQTLNWNLENHVSTKRAVDYKSRFFTSSAQDQICEAGVGMGMRLM